MEAERRQVTVLFADLVGFTSFSERSEEEAAKPVEVWTRQCVSRAVTFEALQVTAAWPCLAPRLRWKTRRFRVSCGAQYPSTAQGSRVWPQSTLQPSRKGAKKSVSRRARARS